MAKKVMTKKAANRAKLNRAYDLAREVASQTLSEMTLATRQLERCQLRHKAAVEQVDLLDALLCVD